ncbi:MAG: S24 family peptidase [Syntrophomonadaceae bacterium]|nr:S24 family peptidase [Syntrophomonadaceae bacterium]
MYTRIGGKIRKAREERGFSQHDLGTALGLTATAINYYEKGKRKVSIEELYRLSGVLKKPLQYFLPGEPVHIKTELIRGVSKVPVLGKVPAGIAFFSEQNLLGYLPVPSEKAGDDLFALVVEGNSMVGKGICDGDMVLIRRQQRVDYNGQIVCALVKGSESALKIWLKKNDKITLKSANPSYGDIVFDDDGSLTIQGVYAGTFKFPCS